MADQPLFCPKCGDECEGTPDPSAPGYTLEQCESCVFMDEVEDDLYG